MFNLIKKKKKTSVGEHRKLTDLKFEVNGASVHKSNVRKLKIKNPDYNLSDAKFKENYDKPVSQYYYINKPVKLVPVPANRYDAGTVHVYIAGHSVGYVPDELAEQVKFVLENRDVKSISASIDGGSKTKYVEDGKVCTKSNKNLNVIVEMKYI